MLVSWKKELKAVCGGGGEEKRRDNPSLSAHKSVSSSSHMSSGLKLLSPGSEDHRKAATDKLLAETGI